MDDSWADGICNVNFFDDCVIDTFCINCLVAYCSHCCEQRHLSHDIIKIMELEGCAALKVLDVERFCDCGGIKRQEDPRVAQDKFVLIWPRNCEKNQECRGCTCAILTGHHYCSLSCKIEKTGNPDMIIKSLLEHGEAFVLSRLQKDSFCITCCTAYCSGICNCHGAHKFVVLDKFKGQLCARSNGSDEWISSFQGVQHVSYTYDDVEYWMMPMTRAEQCLYCRDKLSKVDSLYCSLVCKVKHQRSFR